MQSPDRENWIHFHIDVVDLGPKKCIKPENPYNFAYVFPTLPLPKSQRCAYIVVAGAADVPRTSPARQSWIQITMVH
jgi:hypothetical protein